MYKMIKRWHDMGLWSDKMEQDAVKKSVLTQEQADNIIGGDPT